MDHTLKCLPDGHFPEKNGMYMVVTPAESSDIDLWATLKCLLSIPAHESPQTVRDRLCAFAARQKRSDKTVCILDEYLDTWFEFYQDNGTLLVFYVCGGGLEDAYWQHCGIEHVSAIPSRVRWSNNTWHVSFDHPGRTPWVRTTAEGIADMCNPDFRGDVLLKLQGWQDRAESNNVRDKEFVKSWSQLPGEGAGAHNKPSLRGPTKRSKEAVRLFSTLSPAVCKDWDCPSCKLTMPGSFLACTQCAIRKPRKAACDSQYGSPIHPSRCTKRRRLSVVHDDELVVDVPSQLLASPARVHQKCTSPPKLSSADIWRLARQDTWNSTFVNQALNANYLTLKFGHGDCADAPSGIFVCETIVNRNLMQKHCVLMVVHPTDSTQSLFWDPCLDHGPRPLTLKSLDEANLKLFKVFEVGFRGTKLDCFRYEPWNFDPVTSTRQDCQQRACVAAMHALGQAHKLDSTLISTNVCQVTKAVLPEPHPHHTKGALNAVHQLKLASGHQFVFTEHKAPQDNHFRGTSYRCVRRRVLSLISKGITN